jgi:cation transport regulator ChaB
MAVAVVLLGTILFMALVTLWDQHKDLKQVRGWYAEVTAELVAYKLVYVALEKKYTKQSDDTQQVLVALVPLIEQTDWLGPQPYNSGGLPALQAKENKRNQEVVRVRELLMNLPLVRDYALAGGRVWPKSITFPPQKDDEHVQTP